MGRLRYVIGCGAVALTLAGCDRVGSPFEVLGGKLPPPDEFGVVTRKPLQMPGSLNLPEPRLGERSPLELNPSETAVAALLGPNAASRAGAPSAGESALLAAANATADQSAIRTQLVAEAKLEDENKPYEAPLLADIINGKDTVKRDALDPNAEARRLQGGGVLAPTNPIDRPPEEPLVLTGDESNPERLYKTENALIRSSRGN